MPLKYPNGKVFLNQVGSSHHKTIDTTTFEQLIHNRQGQLPCYAVLSSKIIDYDWLFSSSLSDCPEVDIFSEKDDTVIQLAKAYKSGQASSHPLMSADSHVIRKGWTVHFPRFPYGQNIGSMHVKFMIFFYNTDKKDTREYDAVSMRLLLSLHYLHLPVYRLT